MFGDLRCAFWGLGASWLRAVGLQGLAFRV